MASSDSEEEDRQRKDRLQKAARLKDVLGIASFCSISILSDQSLIYLLGKIQDDKVSVRLEALKGTILYFGKVCHC